MDTNSSKKSKIINQINPLLKLSLPSKNTSNIQNSKFELDDDFPYEKKRSRAKTFQQMIFKPKLRPKEADVCVSPIKLNNDDNSEHEEQRRLIRICSTKNKGSVLQKTKLSSIINRKILEETKEIEVLSEDEKNKQNKFYVEEDSSSSEYENEFDNLYEEEQKSQMNKDRKSLKKIKNDSISGFNTRDDSDSSFINNKTKELLKQKFKTPNYINNYLLRPNLGANIDVIDSKNHRSSLKSNESKYINNILGYMENKRIKIKHNIE